MLGYRYGVPPPTRRARRAPPTRRQARALSNGPPTEGGDYAAGALSVAAPSLAPFRPLVRCLYGAAPVPCLRTGLRDGREAKVRPAAASRGRPSAGTKPQPQLPSIYLSPPTNPAIHLPGYLIHRTNIANPVSLLCYLSVHLDSPHTISALYSLRLHRRLTLRHLRLCTAAAAPAAQGGGAQGLPSSSSCRLPRPDTRRLSHRAAADAGIVAGRLRRRVAAATLAAAAATIAAAALAANQL